MKRVLVLTLAMLICVSLTGVVYAVDDEEITYGGGIHVMSFTGGDGGFGFTAYGYRDNFMVDLGYTIIFDLGLENGPVGNLDGTYNWYSTDENDEKDGLFGGLGVGLLFRDEIEFGVVGQVGYETPGGFHVRAKYGIMTDDNKPFYFILGYSF